MSTHILWLNTLRTNTSLVWIHKSSHSNGLRKSKPSTAWCWWHTVEASQWVSLGTRHCSLLLLWLLHLLQEPRDMRWLSRRPIWHPQSAASVNKVVKFITKKMYMKNKSKGSFLFSLVVWKLLWKLAADQPDTKKNWELFISPLFFIL